MIAHDAHGHHDHDLAAFLHRDEQVAHAQHELLALIRDLVRDAIKTGDVRNDVSPDELASYCLHSLQAASRMPSKAAVRRLAAVTLAGLRPAQPARLSRASPSSGA